MFGWTMLLPWKVNAERCVLPHHRERCFAVAYKLDYADVVGGMPQELRTFGNDAVMLGEMFYTTDDVEEHATRDPTETQKSNIEKFNTELDKKISGGKIVVPANATMHFVIDASRKGPGHGRGRSIHVNRVPALTT
eukprot:3377050-Pyramimonas_sp.AAC.1